MRSIVEAVDPETIETLGLWGSKAAGDWLAPLVGRKFKRLSVLNLFNCKGLQSLPQGVFDGMGELEGLTLFNCEGLRSLPEGVFDKLDKLETLYLTNCPAAKSLPQSVKEALVANGCKIYWSLESH